MRDADRIVAEVRASQGLSREADPALAARAEILLANDALLAGDLADNERHCLLAVELARTAAGQEGLALALTASTMSAISGRGIQPATLGVLDEVANLTAARADRFTETIMHHWQARAFATMGQLEAVEPEIELCWAPGRGGAVPLVEFPRSASRGPPRRGQGRYRCRH